MAHNFIGMHPVADPGSLDPIGGVTKDADEAKFEASGELSSSVPAEEKPQFPGLSWWRALVGRWRREDRESYACYALMVRQPSPETQDHALLLLASTMSCQSCACARRNDTCDALPAYVHELHLQQDLRTDGVCGIT